MPSIGGISPKIPFDRRVFFFNKERKCKTPKVFNFQFPLFFNMKKYATPLYICLLILTLLDVLTTGMLLEMGGIETNPIAVWQWEKLGMQNATILKVGSVFFLGFIVWLIHIVRKTEREEKIANYVVMGILTVLTLFYIGVVCNNIYWIWVASLS